VSATAARRSIAAALAAAGVVATAGIGIDLAYRDEALEDARTEVRELVETQARALATALGRRMALVEGLRAWLATGSGTRLEDFDVFAATLAPTVPGVRAVQVVDQGVIVRSWPPDEGERVIGYDLRSHPDPRVRENFLLAQGSDSLVVGSTTELLQGGAGFVLRRRVPGATPEASRLAAIVVDLTPMLNEAGIGGPSSGLDVELSDPSGRVLVGSLPEGEEGVEVSVPAAGRSWRLRARPREGWRLDDGSALRLAEGLGALTVALVGLLAFHHMDRRRGLEEAVLLRTAQVDRVNRELEAAVSSLRAQEDRLEMALRAGGVTTWEWDLERDELRHYPRTPDPAGDPATGVIPFAAVAERVHPDDLAGFREAERRTRSEGADFDVEYRVVQDDGTVRWFHDTGRASADGTRVRGAMADVTRDKELEEQLAHARKLEAVGQLAGGVAHDFNNLMQVILGHTTLLRLDHEGDELREGLDEITRAAEHASRLTGQLLAFGRRRAVRPEPLKLGAQVKEAASMLRRLLGSEVRVREEPHPVEVVVAMDPSQLTQVIVNLSVNARDAMPGGGTLTLRTGVVDVPAGRQPAVLAPGRYGVLEVEDEGTGMSEEIQGRIFDPFFTTKEPGRGTGLGLASVYGAVKQAGGDVLVRSAPGEGTTFRILLPLSDAGAGDA
jgi:signal transduction histidine kinase